jgi:signal transduction histidine kinase
VSSSEPDRSGRSDIERERRIDASLQQLVHQALPWVLSIVGSLFVFFAATAHLVLPPEDAAIQRWIGVVTAVVLLGLRAVLGRLKLSSDGAHAVMLLATGLCITSAGSHMVLAKEPLLSNWFLLMLVGLSQITFSRRWFFILITLVLVAWLAIVSFIGWSVPVRLYAIAMVSFYGAAVMVFFSRRKSLYRLEDMRLRSEQQRLDLELSKIEVEDARDEAQRANAIKSQFLANMSHELRTPLNAIIGYAEMIQEDAADAGHDQYTGDLQKVGASAHHLLGLINDILDLSKIEAGRMEAAIESTAIAEVIDDVAATVKPSLERNDDTLKLDIHPSIGKMWTDPVRVRQILLNLLSNAAKFTHAGVVTLRVAPTDEDGRPHVEFVVTDTGVGIDPGRLGGIFDAFRQAESSTTKKFGGTGLGLTICRRLCEMLGGTIEVSSEPGRGSRFVVRLPRDSRAEATEHARV